MKTDFDATVVNGGLQFDEPLDLSENSRVRVTVVPVPPDNGKREFGRFRGKIKIAMRRPLMESVEDLHCPICCRSLHASLSLSLCLPSTH